MLDYSAMTIGSVSHSADLQRTSTPAPVPHTTLGASPTLPTRGLRRTSARISAARSERVSGATGSTKPLHRPLHESPTLGYFPEVFNLSPPGSRPVNDDQQDFNDDDEPNHYLDQHSASVTSEVDPDLETLPKDSSIYLLTQLAHSLSISSLQPRRA
jgi:hypothetical protein